MKWRNVSGVLYDYRIPMNLMEEFYKTVIRSSMLDGIECVIVKK